MESSEGTSGIYDLLVNGNSAGTDAKLQVSYGQMLQFSLDGFQGNIEYYVLQDTEWTSISDGYCTLEPGTYSLSYGYYVDDAYTAGPLEGYSLTVTPAEIAAPAELQWNGDTLQWSAPDSTTDGGQLFDDPVEKYLISIYKNGELLSSFDSFEEYYLHFSNFVFNDWNYREGVYSFKVAAIAAESALGH